MPTSRTASIMNPPPPRRSPMGVGAIALGAIAWLLVAGSFKVDTPHVLSGLALIIAISGAAVAYEGRKVEAGTSPRQKRWGLWINLIAIIAAIVMIVMEITWARRG
jgi:hypothetical protein